MIKQNGASSPLARGFGPRGNCWLRVRWRVAGSACHFAAMAENAQSRDQARGRGIVRRLVRAARGRTSRPRCRDHFDASLYYIGRIRTPWNRREDCPKNARESDAVCTIELDPRWAEGLTGLETVSHVLLLYWMDKARRDLLVQSPRHYTDRRGTFALRSPARPNPIAASVARLLAHRRQQRFRWSVSTASTTRRCSTSSRILPRPTRCPTRRSDGMSAKGASAKWRSSIFLVSLPTFAPSTRSQLRKHNFSISGLPKPCCAQRLHQNLQARRVAEFGRNHGAVEIGAKSDAVLAQMFEQVIDMPDDQLDRRVLVVAAVRTQKRSREIDADQAAGFPGSRPIADRSDCANAG